MDVKMEYCVTYFSNLGGDESDIWFHLTFYSRQKKRIRIKGLPELKIKIQTTFWIKEKPSIEMFQNNIFAFKNLGKFQNIFEVRHFHSVYLYYYGLLTFKLDYKLPLNTSQIRLKKMSSQGKQIAVCFSFQDR